MNLDLWNKFKSTGSVFDYLDYKNNENDDELSRIEIINANNNQGSDYKGTNDSRK